MCKAKKYKKIPNNRIDKCMIPLIKWLKSNEYVTVASCCGHDKYPMTVIVLWIHRGKKAYYELFTDTSIPRTRNFYRRDKQGYYFIPELKHRWKNDILPPAKAGGFQ